jgi:beta-phosphoglucomutase
MAGNMPVGPFKAAIFDLDGVLVDTARYHYQAWKALAAELGFFFSEEDNERLKGVSRMRSLEILLEVGGKHYSEGEKIALAERKNARYVELISSLDDSALLPGAKPCLEVLRKSGVTVALASASKNAKAVVDALCIAPLFNYIVDAGTIVHAKPAPDIFLAAAEGLGVTNSEAVVFEDAQAGVQAAHAAGMFAVGVGSEKMLSEADMVVADLTQIRLPALFAI